MFVPFGYESERPSALTERLTSISMQALPPAEVDDGNTANRIHQANKLPRQCGFPVDEEE